MKNISNNLKIIVNIFYPPTSNIKKFIESNPVFLPINGGSSLVDDPWAKEHCLFDNVGENISDKNALLNELTSVYWAWKHYSEIGNPDYIGFNHYRRYFSKIDDFADHDYIVGKPIRAAGINLATQYAIYHRFTDLQLAVNAMKCVDLASTTEFIEYINQNDSMFAPCNMFITTRENFHRYCAWLFPLMFEIMKVVIPHDRSAYQMRALAFLSERLTSFYMWREAKKYDVVETNIVMVK